MLQMLEQREQALVERLKHTQMAESKAKQMLIDAIMVTSENQRGKDRTSLNEGEKRETV